MKIPPKWGRCCNIESGLMLKLMEKIVLSTIEISELVKLISAEVVKQITPFIEKPAVIPESKRLIGDKEAAAYLGCSKMTVGNLRKRGAISYYRYGRKLYYLSNELDEALKVQRRFGSSRRMQRT